MIDFSNYSKTKTYYGGSERKFGILIKSRYFVPVWSRNYVPLFY